LDILWFEAETITITLPNGGVVPAELAGYDHTTGFGILKTILPSN
jgi:serine protease Do